MIRLNINIFLIIFIKFISLTINWIRGIKMSNRFHNLVWSSKFQSIIMYVILAVIIIFSTYLRLLPAINYGLKYLNEADPWERYWLSLYFYNNLFDFSGLKHVTFWWYPWGRNFLKTEYLGMSLLTVIIAKIFNLKQSNLIEILGLLPVAFSVIAMLGTFFAINKITGSKLAGLSSLAVIALYPIILFDQTFANFPGKRIFGFALISWFLYFFAISLDEKISKKAMLIYSFLAGIIGGLVGWFWGGYEYIALMLAIFMLLEPFIIKPNIKSLLNYLLVIFGFTIVIALSPTVGISFYTHSIGLGLIGVVILYLLEEEIWRLNFLRKIHIKYNFDIKMHLWFLIVVFGILVSLILTGFVSLPSRVLLALGITPIRSVISLTVAEYQSVSFGQAMTDYGVLFLVSIIGLIAEFYIIYINKGKISRMEILKLATFIYGFIFMYASINEAYFLSSAAFFLALSTGVSIGSFLSFKSTEYNKKTRKIIEKPNYSAIAAGVILSIIILGMAINYSRSDYNTLRLMAPDIETGYLGPISVPTPNGGSKLIAPINSAWLDALSYIKNNTDNNAVIVSWWDYGYWIGVLGNRTTVVDGSTINGTQIQIVADAFTSTLNTSLGYLTLLKLPANDTYLVTYDIFLGIYNNYTKSVAMIPYPSIYTINPSSGIYGITYGLGDIAKSYQMLRIANKVNPIYGNPLISRYSSISTYNNYVYYQFPAFYGNPNSNVSLTLNTTIYNLMLYGISVLNNYGYLGYGASFLKNATSFTPAAVSYIDPTTGNLALQQLSVPNPTSYYMPVKIFISIPYSWSLPNSGNTYFYAVVVFLYKAQL